MSKRSVLLYLDDIKTAIKRIEEYTDKLLFEKFCDDAKTIDAVVRNLEIIGEAAKHIPEEVSLKYPAVPWKKIGSMRDKVIHEYFGIDVEIIWQTVKEDIPKLKKQIEKIR